MSALNFTITGEGVILTYTDKNNTTTTHNFDRLSFAEQGINFVASLPHSSLTSLSVTTQPGASELNERIATLIAKSIPLLQSFASSQNCSVL